MRKLFFFFFYCVYLLQVAAVVGLVAGRTAGRVDLERLVVRHVRLADDTLLPVTVTCSTNQRLCSPREQVMLLLSVEGVRAATRFIYYYFFYYLLLFIYFIFFFGGGGTGSVSRLGMTTAAN